MDIDTYLLSLPHVETATLLPGALFVANGKTIYQVMDAGLSGTYKARQWRQHEATDVALAPNTGLALYLPLVTHGRLLPAYPARTDLLHNGVALIFVFPTEQNAFEAAALDVALCGARSGLYVRRQEPHPAFEATNGGTVFRLYYFMRTDAGVSTTVPDLKYRLGRPLIPHIDGPGYWRLLPAWDSGPYDVNKTVAMRPVNMNEMLDQMAATQKTVRNRAVTTTDLKDKGLN